MADGPFDPETGELIPRPPVEKDRGDIDFLRHWFAARGIEPPEVT